MFNDKINNCKNSIKNKSVSIKNWTLEYFDKPFFRALSYLPTLLSPIVLIDSAWLVLGYCFYILILPLILFRCCNKWINKFLSSILLYLVFLFIWLELFFNPKINEVSDYIINLEDKSFIYNFIDSIIGNENTHCIALIVLFLVLLIMTVLPFMNYLKAYRECIEKK